VRTPGEVFTYMSTNKLGERVALFWVAWAYVAEKALNYKLTDQIFQKGECLWKSYMWVCCEYCVSNVWSRDSFLFVTSSHPLCYHVFSISLQAFAVARSPKTC